MSKFKMVSLLLAVLMVLPLAVFAQDPTEEPVEEVVLPEVDPLTVEGDLNIAGSSTVGPLAEVVVARFEEAGYTGTISLDSSVGTGGGFERFCVNAETDISNASRPIKDSEVEACAENGRTAVGFQVGVDALAVVVSIENDFIGEEGLTTEQLAQIYSGGADITWADVNPEWPAEPIALFSPGTDSGTFDFFSEHVFADLSEETGNDDTSFIPSAAGVQLSEDDNVLVQGVSASPYAIGYFGFAYLEHNQNLLRAVAVDGVYPSAESVLGGEDIEPYPLSRPLFIFTAPEIIAEKPQVADFVNYFLTNVNEVITEVGYFPQSDELLNEAKATLLELIEAAGN